MRRINAALSILCVLFLFASCGGGKAPAPPEALSGGTVLKALENLERSYSRRDVNDVLAGISPRFADREGLVTALKTVFARYDSAVLRFQRPKMLVVVPDRGDLKVTVTWEGEWRTAGGDRLKDGGRVTLLLDPASVQLTGIDGRSFFVPVQKQLPDRVR